MFPVGSLAQLPSQSNWPRHSRFCAVLTYHQEVDETPDYSDSDTNPNTTASSVHGDTVDGRKKRSEANQLRRSIFGKKHDRLGESKVRAPTVTLVLKYE